MNPAIGTFVGVSKQTEMLLMTILALWTNIFDMAIFEISSNLDQVWNVEIDNEIFNPNAEYVTRMLLSGVVLVRTFTLHLYIAFLIAVFWPVCFGTRPTLMLPWLVVSAIKNLGTGLVSIGTGGYTCMIYGPLRPACLRFLLSQLIDLSPSFYMWFVGLSLYCDLKKPKTVNILQVKAMEDQELNVALRRRKVKSMIDEEILRQQFESRSFQKKFLGTSAVKVNEIITRCSYYNLKNKFSRSLDSLLDVLTVQTELLEIEDSEPLDIVNSSTLQQKTAKLLGISMNEIDYIKQNRQARTNYPIIQHQKNTQAVSTMNSRYESPAKLLPETSLYSPPNIKPIRVTKSELKSAKDFSKIESELIQSEPEKEIQVHDISQSGSFESLRKMQMQIVYQLANSSLKPDVAKDSVNKDSTNILPKKKSTTKEHGWKNSYKNRDRYARKQDGGKLENVHIEIPTKYKFSNTMSDKSHYLLDEHSFLFDKKRSINQNPSEKKQRCLNTPIIDVSNTTISFKDNVSINQTLLDEKPKDNLGKIKESLINKKNLKQPEKKTIAKKILSNDNSNIPVSHRNVKGKNGYYDLNKNKVDVNKNYKNIARQENKLYTIDKIKNIPSVSGHDEKNNDLDMNKITEENKLIANGKETNNASSVHNQQKENKNNIVLLEKDNSIPAGKSKKLVTAEIEENNQMNLKISPKNDLFEFVENSSSTSSANKFEMFNKLNYLRSMELGIPLHLVSIPPQKKAINPKEKILSQQKSKHLLSNTISKTSRTLSENVLMENNSPKTHNMSFEEKNNETESLKTINHNEVECTSNIKEKEINFPLVESSIRYKQLVYHFKENNTKIKDNRMEDLFKKKNALEKKDSKATDKEKLGFPSYFSNKINRMITDACQIRKKSCQKINLFINVPISSDSKQKSKPSTKQMFRKRSPPKTNLFDTTSKLSARKFKISSYKGNNFTDSTSNLNKNKEVLNRTELNLFDMEESKSKTAQENICSSHKPNSTPTLQSLSKTSVQSYDKTVNRTDKVSINLFEDKHNKTSLISPLISFETNKEVNKIDEPICVTKNKSSTSTNANTKEAQLGLIFEQKQIDNSADNIKKTEYEINKFHQKSKTSTTASKSSFPSISENRICKKLSEQSINKIRSIKKSYYSTEVNVLKMNLTVSNSCSNNMIKKISCKRLSEQALIKMISLRNMEYKNFLNMEFKNNISDNKLNTSMVHGTKNCRRLFDFAFNKLLKITNQKCSSKTHIDNKSSSSILCSKTNTENKEEIMERRNDFLSMKHSGIPINITKSDKSNKALKATQSEKSNSLHLNDSECIVNRKNSIPVIKKDILTCQKSLKTISSITKIENNNEKKSDMEKESTDHTSKGIKRKSFTKMNIPINMNSKKASAHSTKPVASTNNVFSNNSNSNILENIAVPVENQNNPIINTEIKNCKDTFELDSSIEIEPNNITHSPSNETMLTTKKQQIDKYYESCKWENQDSISFIASNRTLSTNSKEAVSTTDENQNILNIKDENANPCSKRDISPKEENVNNCRNKEEKECYESSSRKNECSIKIHSHRNKAMLKTELFETNPIKKKGKFCKWTPQQCIQIIPSSNSRHVEAKTSIPEKEQNIFITDKEELKTKSSNNTSKINISVNNKEKPIKNIFPNTNNEHQTNIPLVKDTSQTVCNSNQLLKGTKICKGTSKHNIKLISSNKNESSNETNVCDSKTVSSQTKNDYQYIPLIEQKVCKGFIHNYVKLISSNKDQLASITNLYHKEALSNLLKEYQSVSIIKKEKMCKGTSKHKIKLVSSYMNDTPNKINLFQTETESKNNKNRNITIFKAQKNCKGVLQRKIELISSTKNNSPNKKIVIFKELLSKKRNTIPVNKEDNNDSRQNGAKHAVNLFVKNKIICTDDIKIKNKEENNSNEDYNVETVRKMTLFPNTIQDLLKIDTRKLIKDSLLNKTNTDLVTANDISNEHPLVDMNSSEILYSLIEKVETSIKLQESNKGALFDETPKCYLNNQPGKNKLEKNPNEVTKKLSFTKAMMKSSTNSYQNINLQKKALAMTANQNNRSIFNNEKKDSTTTLNSRNSRNASYVSIHKERLEKAKRSELDSNKSVILQDCTFLDDGYSRLYNLLEVKQKNFDIKPRKKNEFFF